MIDGHGHVKPRADGDKVLCGGPALCLDCAREQAQERAKEPDSDGVVKPEKCLRCERMYDMRSHRGKVTGHEDLYCPHCLAILITGPAAR